MALRSSSTLLPRRFLLGSLPSALAAGRACGPLTGQYAQYGADWRLGFDLALAVRDVPSVLFGAVTFDPQTRRVRHPASIDLQVRNGAFALWDGKPATGGQG